MTTRPPTRQITPRSPRRPRGFAPPDPGCGIIPPQTVRALRQTAFQFAACLLVGLALILAAGLHAPPARSQEAAPASNIAEEVPAGLFFLVGLEDRAYAAPALESQVAITVNGLVQRVTVTQRFRNPTEAWLEALYVFPLPEGSAVDRLTLVIGDRRVAGMIKEKNEAKRIYEAAKAEGKRASLLSAARPNVFSTALANIGPGEEILVEIEYQDKVRSEAGLFSLRFPMVVAPRYSPAPPVALSEAPLSDDSTTGLQPAVLTATDEGRDLFGPVRHPDEGAANPLRLAVMLDAGLPLAAIDSPYHDVIIDSLYGNRQLITLAAETAPANRDFLLEWRPVASAEPQAAIFAEEVEGAAHLLLTVLPPGESAGAPAPAGVAPRDMVFVIDTSGSMYGESLAEAKEALLRALTRLKPDDRFNVIRFADDLGSLFDGIQPATAGKVEAAWFYVKALEAEGGTEMRPALRLALAEAAQSEMAQSEMAQAGRLKQVVFITDGAVSNEVELFQEIAANLGGTRLFTVGIGSAPNGYFMTKAAAAGRGTYTYIGDLSEIGSRMAALFERLERPALIDVAVDWGDLAVEGYPNPLPDLYAGQPLTFTARLEDRSLDDLKGTVTITGRRGGESWRRSLELANLLPAPGVAALWARAKIDTIEEGLHLGQPTDRVRAAALRVALAHQLVTRYSALVAVDDEIARPQDAVLRSGDIARDLPAGWDHEKVFGPGAANLRLQHMPQGLIQAPDAEPIALPRGATPAALQIAMGLALLAAGLSLLVLSRRRGPAAA